MTEAIKVDIKTNFYIDKEIPYRIYFRLNGKFSIYSFVDVSRVFNDKFELVFEDLNKILSVSTLENNKLLIQKERSVWVLDFYNKKEDEVVLKLEVIKNI